MVLLDLSPQQLLAAVQSGVMARSLGIALVIVAPFWVVRRRRIRARRAELAAVTDTTPTGPEGPSLETLVDEIGVLAAAARQDADGTGADGSVTIRVPHGLTVDGSEAPASVVDAIVRDAIQRSGLVPTAELDTAEARIIECRPRLSSRAASGRPPAPTA